ncbi:DivIVA domain-containing protein [Prauserella shujinwangii]|uniref:Cell wall synthesis protein Wag31 n=1 Tax=Prauserella shujinwangii TaxID=1453103 RepID=A0A2T0LND6_9PSEU|nr:DivIVA domain-containing protein [Prauserella shujinwangii]PRX44693.1 DivIVA domain-containing protein [Prauserella shujinwangii]
MTLQANDHRQPGFRRVLTPDRIRNITFKKSPLGRRGVDPDEVELFQRRLAEEIAAGEAENARLRAEIDRLRNWYRDHGENVDAVPAQQLDVQAVNLLSEAQLQAEAYIAQAEAHCRRVTVDARRQADAILHDAQQRAEDAAQEAAHAYRARAGDGYAAELEEMERRLAWLRAFSHAVQVQLQATSSAFAQEIDKLARLPEKLRKSGTDVEES